MGGKRKVGPQVLAIANQKGGVGKTTTAVSLAASFAKDFGKKVLVIDADFQANASSYLGMKTLARQENKTLAEGLIDRRHQEMNRKLEEVILQTQHDGIDLVAGSMELARFNNEKYNPYKLRNWLKAPTLKDYDIVIIDTHPDLSHIFINVMSCADYYLIPLFAEPDSFDGLAIMFDEIREIKANFNSTLYLLGCCITRFNPKNATHRKFRSEIESLGAETNMPLLGEIPVSDAIAASSDNKVPIAFYKPFQDLPVRGAYEALAGKLVNELRARRGRSPDTPELSPAQVDKLFNKFTTDVAGGGYVFE